MSILFLLWLPLSKIMLFNDYVGLNETFISRLPWHSTSEIPSVLTCIYLFCDVLLFMQHFLHDCQMRQMTVVMLLCVNYVTKRKWRCWSCHLLLFRKKGVVQTQCPYQTFFYWSGQVLELQVVENAIPEANIWCHNIREFIFTHSLWHYYYCSYTHTPPAFHYPHVF